MDGLGDVLKRRKNQLGAGAINAGEVAHCWQEVAREVMPMKIADGLAMVSFKNGTLKLKVSDSSTANLAVLYSQELKDCINSRVGEGAQVKKVQLALI